MFIDAGIKDGYTFTGWTCPETVTFEDPTNVKTFFTMIAKAVAITATWLATHDTRLATCKAAVEAAITNTTWNWNSTKDDLSGIVNTTITATDTEVTYEVDDENTTTTLPTNIATGSIVYVITLKLGEQTTTVSGTIILPIVPVEEWAFNCAVTGSTSDTTGAGKYKKDSVVAIKAGVKAGHTFGGWTCDNTDVVFADAAVADTTFTMLPADVTIVATWTMIDYVVTLDESCDIVGEGGTTYHIGDTVAVTCNSAEFVEWSCSEPTVMFADKADPTTTFTMPAANITLDHSFKTHTLTVESDGSTTTGGGSYMAGVVVTIDAGVKADYTFNGWTSSDENVAFADATSTSTTITTLATDVTVTANWTKILYTVTIDGNGAENTAGFGAGEYAYGDTVQLHNISDASRYKFVEWNCTVGEIVLTDKTNADSTFTMPRNNVTMTLNASKGGNASLAISKDGADPETTSDKGFIVVGTSIPVVCSDITGYTFNGWTCESDLVVFADATALSTTFTMPDVAAVEVVATYTAIVYTITMDGSCNTATGDGTFNYGDTVSIACTNADFIEWSCDDPTVVFADKTNASTTFVMPAKNIAIEHSFKTHTVTIAGGATGTTGGGSYLDGATVTLNAGTKAGSVFKNWTSSDGSVVFANASATSTTFAMPHGDVTITANWNVLYTVAVTGSTVSAGENGSGSYVAGATVTVKAGTPAAGMEFVGWECSTGNVTPL